MKRIFLLFGLAGVCCLSGLQAPALAQVVHETRGGLDAGTTLDQTGQFQLRNVIGKSATNRQGQALGIVEDVIANERGQIQYFILSADRDLGMTERLVPVPWQAAGVSVQRDRITLDLTRNQLDNAPTFTRRNLQDLSRPQVQQKINSYYQTGRIEDRDDYRYDDSEDYRYDQRRYPERENGYYEPGEGELGTYGEYESQRIDGDFERRDDDYDLDDERYPSRSPRTYNDFEKDTTRDDGRIYD